MQEFKEELKRFGSIFLTAFDLDEPTSTEHLKDLNNKLEQNPDFLKMLADKKFQKKIQSFASLLGSKNSPLSKILN